MLSQAEISCCAANLIYSQLSSHHNNASDKNIFAWKKHEHKPKQHKDNEEHKAI